MARGLCCGSCLRCCVTLIASAAAISRFVLLCVFESWVVSLITNGQPVMLTMSVELVPLWIFLFIVFIGIWFVECATKRLPERGSVIFSTLVLVVFTVLMPSQESVFMWLNYIRYYAIMPPLNMTSCYCCPPVNHSTSFADFFCSCVTSQISDEVPAPTIIPLQSTTGSVVDIKNTLQTTYHISGLHQVSVLNKSCPTNNLDFKPNQWSALDDIRLIVIVIQFYAIGLGIILVYKASITAKMKQDSRIASKNLITVKSADKSAVSQGASAEETDPIGNLLKEYLFVFLESMDLFQLYGQLFSERVTVQQYPELATATLIVITVCLIAKTVFRDIDTDVIFMNSADNRGRCGTIPYVVDTLLNVALLTVRVLLRFFQTNNSVGFSQSFLNPSTSGPFLMFVSKEVMSILFGILEIFNRTCKTKLFSNKVGSSTNAVAKVTSLAKNAQRF